MRITPDTLANSEALRERFAAAIATQLRARPDEDDARCERDALSSAALPSALAHALADAPILSPQLLEHYLTRMPERLIAQWTGLPPALAALVDGPIPGAALAAYLATMARLLDEAGLSFAAHLGARGPTALLAARPSIAALYFGSFFGGGLPMLGLSELDRPLLVEALARGASAAEVFEAHLLGPLMHELCHGARREVTRAPLFLLTEAAAIHLGGAIEPRHVFAEREGEAVPAAGRYYLLGVGVERLLGRRALWALCNGTSPVEAWPAPLAEAVTRVAQVEAAARPDDLFAADASRIGDWLRVIDLARDQVRGGDAAPRTLDEAAAVPLAALPWSREAITEIDWHLVASSIDLLASKTVLRPAIATVPDEIPDGEVVADIERAELGCRARPDGVFGEPARGILPPPIAARLAARGARRLLLRGVRRAARHSAVARLRALVADTGGLPVDVELSC